MFFIRLSEAYPTLPGSFVVDNLSGDKLALCLSLQSGYSLNHDKSSTFNVRIRILTKDKHTLKRLFFYILSNFLGNDFIYIN